VGDDARVRGIARDEPGCRASFRIRGRFIIAREVGGERQLRGFFLRLPARIGRDGHRCELRAAVGSGPLGVRGRGDEATADERQPDPGPHDGEDAHFREV